MKFYCDSCFKKSDYKFSKPKFCPNCGASCSMAASGTKTLIENNGFAGAGEPEQRLIDNPNGTSEKKIKELEKRLSAYERLALSDRIAAKNNEIDISENDSDEMDSRWNGSLESLKGTMKIEFDESRKLGTKFSEILSSSVGENFPEAKMLSSLDDRSKLEIDYDKILKELKEESSSGARIINID